MYGPLAPESPESEPAEAKGKGSLLWVEVEVAGEPTLKPEITGGAGVVGCEEDEEGGRSG